MFFVLKYPWLMLIDTNHATIIRNYGTAFILTKILWNAFINVLHNKNVGFQTVMSI